MFSQRILQLGGGVEMEERSCAGLAPSTARDAAMPAELRVTERSAREAVEAEGAAIAEDAVRAMVGLPPATRPGMWWWTSNVVDVEWEYNPRSFCVLENGRQ